MFSVYELVSSRFNEKLVPSNPTFTHKSLHFPLTVGEVGSGDSKICLSHMGSSLLTSSSRGFEGYGCNFVRGYPSSSGRQLGGYSFSVPIIDNVRRNWPMLSDLVKRSNRLTWGCLQLNLCASFVDGWEVGIGITKAETFPACFRCRWRRLDLKKPLDFNTAKIRENLLSFPSNCYDFPEWPCNRKSYALLLLRWLPCRQNCRQLNSSSPDVDLSRWEDYQSHARRAHHHLCCPILASSADNISPGSCQTWFLFGISVVNCDLFSRVVLLLEFPYRWHPLGGAAKLLVLVQTLGDGKSTH